MSNIEIIQPYFHNVHYARAYLESIRWPNGIICPKCGSVRREHYMLDGVSHRDGLYKCKDCRKPFTVTVGTVFERSKIELNVWLQAVYLICSSEISMNARQLHEAIGVTYVTAWFMIYRIREAMNPTSTEVPNSAVVVAGAGETFGIVE